MTRILSLTLLLSACAADPLARSHDGAPPTFDAPVDPGLRPPPPLLSLSVVTPAGPGEDLEVAVSGLGSGDAATLALSVRGPGAGPCPAALGGGCVDLLSPIRIGRETADASGTARFLVPIPASVADGTPLWLQAIHADGGSSLASPVVETVIDDCPGCVCDPGEAVVAPCGFDDLAVLVDTCDDDGQWAFGDCRTDLTTIEVGDQVACAVTTEGRLGCWGRNDTSQLADGTATDRNRIGEVAGLDGVVDVSTDIHVCAVTDDGAVRCWGSANWGYELGQPVRGVTVSTPTVVAGVSDAIAVATGGAHSCALRETGEVACWGQNASGELGDGSRVQSSVPVAVSGLTDAVAIDANAQSTCALRQSGEVVCWGSNGDGQFGSPAGSFATPVAVPGITDAIDVGVGQAHVCVVRADRSVWCAGQNREGQLGDGTVVSRSSFAEALLDIEVDRVALGSWYGCAHAIDGEARCWGAASSYQLGHQTALGFFQTTPVSVANIGSVRSMTAGVSTTCAIDPVGEGWCWGSNSRGVGGAGHNFLYVGTPARLLAE